MRLSSEVLPNPCWRWAAVVVASCFFAFPLVIIAQEGQDAVYNMSNHATASRAFIDPSMFLPPNDTKAKDLCDAIYYMFNNGFASAGAVIDARGISGSALRCTQGSPWSENNNSSILTVPSTILLPAGTIVTPITWILPSNTHLIGEGDGDPSVATPGTTIQAGSGISGAMIQFGNSTLCTSTTPCSGISVEKVTLDGQGGSLDGIDNQYAGANSWVDHVTLYQLRGAGLSISNQANDSGPYSNITFNIGNNSASGAVCAQIESVTNEGAAGSTRGIHGLTCKTPSQDGASAGRVAQASNSLALPTLWDAPSFRAFCERVGNTPSQKRVVESQSNSNARRPGAVVLSLPIHASATQCPVGPFNRVLCD